MWPRNIFEAWWKEEAEESKITDIDVKGEGKARRVIDSEFHPICFNANAMNLQTRTHSFFTIAALAR